MRSGSRSFALFAFLCLLIPGLVSPLALRAATWGDFTYTVSNNQVTITGYTGAGGALTVPDAINGVPVALIGDRAFMNCSAITSMSLPAGLISVGSYAFYHCFDLTGIKLPEGTKLIGDYAFLGCSSMGTVEIPSTVTSIGRESFGSCANLTSVVIPSSVATLADFAFYNCSRLITVTFSGNAPMVGYSVFGFTARNLSIYHQPGATGFSSPKWQGYPCYLKDGDFAYYAENGAATVGAYAGTASNVVIPDELGGLPVARIGAKAFYNRDSLASVVLPASLALIGDSAFADCANLSAVRFAGDAPSLGSAVFDSAAAGFAVYYPQGAGGFTSPTWAGYPARPFNSAQSFITFAPLPNRVAGTKFALKATASSGLPVSFLVVSGPATLGADGKTVTAGPSAGTVTVRALQPGGVRKGIAYAAAAPVDRTFEVTPAPGKQAQTLAFAQPPAATYGDAPISLTGTASSGLPVSFELVSSAPAGIANLFGNSLAILGAGKVVIKATQPGSQTWKAATPVLRTLVIGKAPLAVSFRPVTRLVGQAAGVVFEPVFGAEADGGSTLHDFVRGDSADDLAASLPSGRSRATNTSRAGQYPISAVGGLDANYRFVPGQTALLTLVGFGGGYETLLEDENETPRGKLSVLVAYDSLAFTGVLELASEPAPIPIRGTLSATDGSVATGAWTRPDANGVAALSLGFKISGDILAPNPQPSHLFCVLVDGEDAFTIPPAPVSRTYVQAISATGAKLPAPWMGGYTLMFEPPGPSKDRAIPQGGGHAFGSINDKGILAIRGQSADGAPLVASAPAVNWSHISNFGLYHLFTRPHGKRPQSFVSVSLGLAKDPERPASLNFAGGGVFCAKAKSPDKPLDPSYREGFEFVARLGISPWFPPSKKPTVIPGAEIPPATLVQRLVRGASSGDSAVLAIDFTDRASFGARADLIPSSFKLAPSGRISELLPTTNPANVSGFTLTITPDTGAFSGSFLLSDQVAPPPAKPVTRKASFSGRLNQGVGSALGYGHVLFDPVAGDTGGDADALVSQEIILSNALSVE